MSRLFFCTDLNRTLLPNGPEPEPEFESEQARRNFHSLVDHAQVTLVYVTGRHQRLVEQAIEEYQLPQLNY